MKCLKCGHEMRIGDNYCYNCGTTLLEMKEDLVAYCKEKIKKIEKQKLKNDT